MSREWVRKQTSPLSPDEAERLRDEALRERGSRIAHQLGNLLQVVNGNLELIAQRTTDETALRYLANARAAAEQLTALARTLPSERPD
jgi:two-component sensor histidine kinase